MAVSFGFSLSDAVLLTQLAWKTVQNARRACGEHDELTHEVSSLHIVLRRLESEIRIPESPLNQSDGSYSEELEVIISGCKKVLNVLDSILKKYNSLSEEERSVKKIWQRIRFGNGQVADLGDQREKLTYYTTLLNMLLNMASAGSTGRVEKKMDTAGNDLKDLKVAVNGITAHLVSQSHHEGSALTAYADDDRAVWKEFRRELLRDGFSSSVLRKHKTTIKAYITELGNRGLLDQNDLDSGTEEALKDRDQTTDARVSTCRSSKDSITIISEEAKSSDTIELDNRTTSESQVYSTAISETARDDHSAKLTSDQRSTESSDNLPSCPGAESNIESLAGREPGKQQSTSSQQTMQSHAATVTDWNSDAEQGRLDGQRFWFIC